MMQTAKSFSIDSLLAKDPPRQLSPSTRLLDSEMTRGRPASPISPDPMDCRSRSPASPDSYRSSPISGTSSPEPTSSPGPALGAPFTNPGPGHGGLIPRPGLLHLQPGGMGHVPPGMFPNGTSGHPLYGYGLHPGSNGPSAQGGPTPSQAISMLSGSAFHSPMEHAMKMAQAQAQIQNIHLDMLARSGVYVPRLMDYASRLQTGELVNMNIHFTGKGSLGVVCHSTRREQYLVGVLDFLDKLGFKMKSRRTDKY